VQLAASYEAGIPGWELLCKWSRDTPCPWVAIKKRPRELGLLQRDAANHMGHPDRDVADTGPANRQPTSVPEVGQRCWEEVSPLSDGRCAWHREWNGAGDARDVQCRLGCARISDIARLRGGLPL